MTKTIDVPVRVTSRKRGDTDDAYQKVQHTLQEAIEEHTESIEVELEPNERETTVKSLFRTIAKQLFIPIRFINRKERIYKTNRGTIATEVSIFWVIIKSEDHSEE